MFSCAECLVEAFRTGGERLTITELARRIGLLVATASRLVTELTEHGWLERDGTRRVRLGCGFDTLRPGRLSLHAFSSGLVLLALGDAAFQQEIIDGPLRRLGTHRLRCARQGGRL